MQMTGWLKQIRQESKKLLCLSLWTEQMLSCQVFLCYKIQAEHPGKPDKKDRCLDWLLSTIWLTHWLALHSYWGNFMWNEMFPKNCKATCNSNPSFLLQVKLYHRDSCTGILVCLIPLLEFRIMVLNRLEVELMQQMTSKKFLNYFRQIFTGQLLIFLYAFCTWPITYPFVVLLLAQGPVCGSWNILNKLGLKRIKHCRQLSSWDIPKRHIQGSGNSRITG